MQELTPKQAAVLDAIRAWWHNAGISPTLRDLADDCGISSTSVVSYILNDLEARHLIRRTPGIARSIVLVERDKVSA